MSHDGPAITPTRPVVTALILAGGAGRRVEGRDKGLIHWRGRPLVEHVHRRVAAQVDEVLISCNRNRDEYAAIGRLAPADLRENHQGPLAGLEAAIPELQGEYVLLVPCDMPLLPEDLAQQLLRRLGASPAAQVCYAQTADSPQYLCAVLRRSALSGLQAFLDSGGRAVHLWYASIGAVALDCDGQREKFLNLNRPG